jgi:hypothetical protein
MALATVTVLATPVIALAGNSGSTLITQVVAGSFVRQGPMGLFAASCGEVGKELVPDPLPVPWIWSTALEFSLASVPAGASVVSATLTMTDADGDSPDPLRIYGYPGNGSVTAADHDQAPGTPVAYTPTGTGPETHDVSSLVGPAALSAGWAGFLVVPDTSDFSTVHHTLDCPGDAQPPTLFITYALPDTAMAPTALSPVASLGAVLFAVAALLLIGRVLRRGQQAL